MTLSLIGSGFGRTGTLSLKTALEQLGYGPCHHMMEVFKDPAQVSQWRRLGAGEPVDWAEVFAGYRAQVDWPGCHYWRELATAYPDAKVIHSVRPEEKWWQSFDATIGKIITMPWDMATAPHMTEMRDVVNESIMKPTFGEIPVSREAGLAAYRKRTEDVRAAIPPQRLLIFDVAEGWQPLCDFLGVAVPTTPFPRLNSTEDFWKMSEREVE